MRILPAGDTAILVELADLDEVLALYAVLNDDRPDGVTDLVPAARTIMVHVAPERIDPESAAAWVGAAAPRRGARPDGESVELAVTYDGPDLRDVARLTGLSEREVVRAHTGQDWTVAFCGFAPGFGYLVGADTRLRVPRRESPRTRVPGGSVGLAGEFTGVYPRESPGGWQLIGRIHEPIWDPSGDPPAMLSAGVRVHFREA